MNLISDNWNDNLQSLNQEKNEAPVRVFYADWTSVPVPRTSSLRGLNVGFIPPLSKELPYMANNHEYTLTNIDVVIFLSASIFGRGYHSRYQNFEFNDEGTNENAQKPCAHILGIVDFLLDRICNDRIPSQSSIF